MSAQTPSDDLQHILFEGCDVCVIAPEDYDALTAQNARLVAALEALHRATIEPTLYMSQGDLNATQKKMRANALDRYADACELTVAALKQAQP